MNEALLADLLRVLDIAIVERLPNSLYHLVTPAPAWLAGAFEEKATGSQRSLGATRPLLIIERLTGDADTRPILQKAREHLLDREQLARQAAAVHAPAAAIDKAI